MEFKMHEKKLADGTKITTFSKTISMANILKVEAGTNGHQGGDTGHGSRTYFRIEDLGSTDIRPICYETEYGNKGLEVTLGGDCELDTIIDALEFIVDVLRYRTKVSADVYLDESQDEVEHLDAIIDAAASIILDDDYRAILKRDAEKRMQEDGLYVRLPYQKYPEKVPIEKYIAWCWKHNAGHWPDGMPITDD